MTDQVGKGSSPKSGRWKKGHSGNPRGRPKGRLNFNTELAAELSEMIQITENGVTKRIPKLRGMLKAMTASAIRGNVGAAQLVMKWTAVMVETPEAAKGRDAAAGFGGPTCHLNKRALTRGPVRKRTSCFPPVLSGCGPSAFTN